ncbi:MAG: hypothetical protein E6889_00805 [Staphylococcus epidermidis]|nr:hypothetical protein [Staphylococcus epidermidis]
MLLRETEDYEKYYKIGNVVMGTAFICIVIFSLMKSTPLSDLSFLIATHFFVRKNPKGLGEYSQQAGQTT